MRKTVIFIVLLVVSLSVWGMGSDDSSRIIRVAGSAGYPPFNYSVNDEIIGFDVDVAREICERLGYTLEYVANPWDTIIDGMLEGQYDVICASMAITDERLQRVDFSEPYYYSGAQLIVREHSGIKEYASITDKDKIGASEGTTYLNDIESKGLTPYYFSGDFEAIDALIEGEIDAVITDRLVALNAILNMDLQHQLVLAGAVHRPEHCAIAFPKGSPLRDEFNRVLAEMRTDGTLTLLSKKWMQGQDITKLTN